MRPHTQLTERKGASCFSSAVYLDRVGWDRPGCIAIFEQRDDGTTMEIGA